MRLFLIALGAVVAASALLFWLYLNAMAAAWVTSGNAGLSVNWLTGEAFIFFWGPFIVGATIAFIGWKRR